MSFTDFILLSDEQLVSMAQSGDTAAADCLIKRYLSVAGMKAKRINEQTALYDADDLTQEAMLGLLSAVYGFRPDKNVCFSTYANVCMNNRLVSVANSMRAKRQIPESAVLPLDELDSLADRNTNPEECVMTDFTESRISELINTGLSDLEQKVFYLFLSGNSYARIAGQLSIDEKSVDNAMQRIRRKLRTLIVK